MIKEYNFDEFAKSSGELWRDKLNQDLGADLAKRISNWIAERNLTLSAYYDDDDLESGMTVPEKLNRSWKYLQPTKAGHTNEYVRDALMNGADGLVLEDHLAGSLENVLDGVAPEHCTLAMLTSTIDNYKKITSWSSKKNDIGNKSEFLLFYNANELSSTITASYQEFMVDAFEIGSKKGHKVINFDCGLVQRKGSSVQLELAYLLAQSVYYINTLIDKGQNIKTIADSLFVSTSIGSIFFLELAKLRVIRMLMAQVLKAYGLKNYSIPIHATTSMLSKSSMDEDTNFLRCTSEAMSAVLGGVDYLTILPHHSLQSAGRIARNISNLLKDESHLAKTANPSEGSYYIENLSKELGSRAWQIFVDIEKKGGFETAIREGFFEREIEKDLEFQKLRISSGKRKLVGVNDFGNTDEQILADKLKREHLSLSQDFEEVRHQVESYVFEKGEDQRPVAYLLGVGSDTKMINARFTFASNFFNWSGIKIEKIGDREKLSPKSMIICCGADDDYDEAIINKSLADLESPKVILAAGKENSEASPQISSWINTRTNRLDGVKDVLKNIGVLK